MPGVAYAGAPIDCWPRVTAAVAQFDVAGVQRHAQLKRAARLGLLDRECAADCVEWVGEGDHEAVAVAVAVGLAVIGRPHPAVGQDGTVDDGVEVGQRGWHLGALLPQATGALDVGQHQRDAPDREIVLPRSRPTHFEILPLHQ